MNVVLDKSSYYPFRGIAFFITLPNSGREKVKYKEKTVKREEEGKGIKNKMSGYRRKKKAHTASLSASSCLMPRPCAHHGCQLIVFLGMRHVHQDQRGAVFLPPSPLPLPAHTLLLLYHALFSWHNNDDAWRDSHYSLMRSVSLQVVFIFLSCFFFY